MQIHQLEAPGKVKKQRVARGGKRGITSGRGTKGQKSRAGHRIRPAMRDLINKIPKMRGFRNKPKSAKPVCVQLRDLSSALAKKHVATITKETLRNLSLIPASYHGKVKILGTVPSFTAKIAVEGVEVSASVKKVIEAAGGSVK